MPQVFSHFANNIRLKKYAHDLPGGLKESWEQTADRVSHHVFRSVRPPQGYYEATRQFIADRVFMPGGRYLAATGRDYHQTQNCLLLKAQDSREGWSELSYKCFQALMTGAGIGVVYSWVRPKGTIIRRTGGRATGPIALMQIINDGGRQIRQGGERRSAIWAGLHWWHQDIFDFIEVKNWPPEVRKLKAQNYAFPATLDGTNISVILDREFFEAFEDEYHPKHKLAHQVYSRTLKQMFSTAEPGFSIDFDEPNECLRNAPVVGGTHVLTDKGYVTVRSIVDQEATVWTGHRWAKTTFKKTGTNVRTIKVKMTGGREITCDPSHPFVLGNEDRECAEDLEVGTVLKVSTPPYWEHDVQAIDHDTAYTMGFVFGDGTFNGDKADVSLCTPEKKSCRIRFDETLISSETLEDPRGHHRIYMKSGDFNVFRTKEKLPQALHAWERDAKIAFVAGLFDADGSFEDGRVRLSSVNKEVLQDVRRLLEELGIMAGISRAGVSGYSGSIGWLLVVQSSFVSKFARVVPTCRLKVRPHKSYRKSQIKVIGVEPGPTEDVYCCDVGVHEHSFMAEGVIISNCTEVTSNVTDDVCNLGSINMARIDSLEQMREAVHYGCAFLLAGTVYSHVPYPEVDMVRSRNRRLGLGLMGLHEWLIKRGKPYGPDPELAKYLQAYAQATEVAGELADMMQLSRPIKTRAIAPTGTIGIVAETTTGIEPIFCVAYKRRYLKTQDVFAYEYVVDPTAKRLIESGIDPSRIEDAYSIGVEQRVAFQAWVQQYVDHGISSTINLPRWGSQLNNEDTLQEYGNMLIRYLPKLRGVTCYPDGAREGQPITACSYEEAMGKKDRVHEEFGDACAIGKGGTCGE